MRRYAGKPLGYLTLFVCIGLAGCSQAPPPAPPEIPKVTVAHPEKRSLTDNVEFNGWLEPADTVDVRARVRGHIQKIHFTDGQMVKKGDLLFELDPRPFKAALDAAKAQLKIAEANYDLASKEYDRSYGLMRVNAAKREEVDVWTAKKAVGDAEKLAAQAYIEKAKLDVEYSRVTADTSGRIGKAQLAEGNLVNAGGSDPVLATIVTIDPIRVVFNVDERLLQTRGEEFQKQGKTLTEVLSALKDTKAPFTFAQDGEREFNHKATLTFGDNRIDPGTGTILAYGTADNKDGRYLPGARVRVRFPIAGKTAPGLLVPETAILADQDKRYVLIADDKNVVRRRNVTLGVLTDDGLRAIQSADKLPDSEKVENWQVLIDNLQRARLNYPIEPQTPPAAVPVAKPAS